MPANVVPLPTGSYFRPLGLSPLAILSLLALASLTRGESSSGQFISGSGCTITYESPAYGNFRFNCMSPQNLSLGWATCLSLCCPAQSPAQYPLPALPALSACNSLKPTDHTTVVLMAVLISVFSLITFLCVSLLLYKLCVNCGRNKVVQEDSGTEWTTPEQLTVDPQLPLWAKTARSRYEESECSICLDAGGSAELVCGHYYHQNCILTWLKRSHFCPLCHRDHIRTLRVYCAACSNQYLLAKTALLELHPHLAKECPSCKEPNKDNSLSSTKLGLPQLN